MAMDHMHIICTSLKRDNHDSNSSLTFHWWDALLGAQPMVSKHWVKAWTLLTLMTIIIAKITVS